MSDLTPGQDARALSTTPPRRPTWLKWVGAIVLAAAGALSQNPVLLTSGVAQLAGVVSGE